MYVIPDTRRSRLDGRLLPKISELRGRTGRPHWIVVDEAHHLLPASRENIAQMLPEELPSVIFITTHPDAVSVEALRTVEVVIALGDKASDAIAQFCELIGLGASRGASPPGDEEALFWDRSAGERIRAVKVDRPQQATSATRASTPRANYRPSAVFISAAPKGSSSCGRKI